MLRENLVQKLCSLTYVPLRYGGGLVELDRVFHGLKETGCQDTIRTNRLRRSRARPTTVVRLRVAAVAMAIVGVRAAGARVLSDNRAEDQQRVCLSEASAESQHLKSFQLEA